MLTQLTYNFHLLFIIMIYIISSAIKDIMLYIILITTPRNIKVQVHVYVLYDYIIKLCEHILGWVDTHTRTYIRIKMMKQTERFLSPSKMTPPTANV